MMAEIALRSVPHVEMIVRALASVDPCMELPDMFHVCALCGAGLPIRADQHDDDCPWRLAVEWVAAHA
jgi:hypothetical protein